MQLVLWNAVPSLCINCVFLQASAIMWSSLVILARNAIRNMCSDCYGYPGAFIWVSRPSGMYVGCAVHMGCSFKWPVCGVCLYVDDDCGVSECNIVVVLSDPSPNRKPQNSGKMCSLDPTKHRNYLVPLPISSLESCVGPTGHKSCRLISAKFGVCIA